MSWYPTETQHREPPIAVRTYRKASALVRWAALVVVTGLVLAALSGIALSSLFSAIENGL